MQVEDESDCDGHDRENANRYVCHRIAGRLPGDISQKPETEEQKEQPVSPAWKLEPQPSRLQLQATHARCAE